MTIELQIRTEHADVIRRALKDPQMVMGPIRSFLQKSGFTVEGQAKENAPVDTGRLRSSITSRVAEHQVFIGSNVEYAPYVEFGTDPHFPPLDAMQPWARRHGFPAGRSGAFLVAQAIARRGTRARAFLKPALESSAGAIKGFLGAAAREIERRWKGG